VLLNSIYFIYLLTYLICVFCVLELIVLKWSVHLNEDILMHAATCVLEVANQCSQNHKPRLLLASGYRVRKQEPDCPATVVSQSTILLEVAVSHLMIV